MSKFLLKTTEKIHILKATKQSISSNQLQHTTKKTNQCKCREVPEKN